jgi:Domain of unknown function (DUF4262)
MGLFRRAVLGLVTRSTSKQLLARVAEVGWTAAYVGDATPPFAYTIGLGPAFHHPELIVVGLPEQATDWLLARAVERIKAGEIFRAGAEAIGLIGEYDAEFIDVSLATMGRLAFAGDVYGGLDFKALQLVWPDRSGRYPWQTDVDAALLDGQPMLGEHVTSSYLVKPPKPRADERAG